MSVENCNIYITTPGVPDDWHDNFHVENEYWKWAQETFQKHMSNLVILVDTVPGWWNLNQDWLEILGVRMDIEWGYSLPLVFTEAERAKLLQLLQKGHLLMIVFTITESGKVIPNR